MSSGDSSSGAKYRSRPLGGCRQIALREKRPCRPAARCVGGRRTRPLGALRASARTTDARIVRQQSDQADIVGSRCRARDALHRIDAQRGVELEQTFISDSR
jgi:hypothetical protein